MPGYHGHIRATGDFDVWIDRSEENVPRLISALREFGFDQPSLRPELFAPNKVIRMGVAPYRIELLTDITGVTFEAAYEARLQVMLDDVPCSMINREYLLQNKQAAGRHKDLDDLEHLR